MTNKLKVYYRLHNQLQWRIRRSDWPYDAFEIVSSTELEHIKIVLRLLSIPYEREKD